MACYPGQPEDLRPKESSYDGKGALDFDMDTPTLLKSHSTRAIVKWLEDTYQYEDCICLPRSTIYEHYSDFCARNQLQPVNAASFGKIIRQQFPSLTTRRLGTRGQSKYHYYGLGIKPTSIYYTEDYVQKQQNQGVPKKEPEAKKTHAYYAAKEKPSAVLPKFPDVKNLNLSSESLPKDKLTTFMVMYRAHCQRILDSVVRANFDEVENFLLHFWQGMPSHLVPVLGMELVVDLVAVCDMALYKAVVSIYIATPLQNIPDNVAQEVRRFTNNLKDWLEPALRGLPECLAAVKLKAADLLCKSFKRQRSLMHLADAARNAFKGEESIEQLENDWGGLNLQTIFAQTLYTIQPLNIPQRYLDMVPNFLAEFSCMFADEKCSLEDFALWIEAVMDNCFRDVQPGSIKTAGKTFLLTWKFFTSKVVREFTLMSAPSFGTFHLLHMLVDDYIMHTLETMLEKEHEDSHMHRINLLRKDGVNEEAKVGGLLSNDDRSAVGSMAPPPADSLSMPAPHKYSQFVAPASSEFKHAISSQDRAPPTDLGGGMAMHRSGGGGMIPGLEQQNKSRKEGYTSPQGMLSQPPPFHSPQDSSDIMNELPIAMEPNLSAPAGLAHNSGLGSVSPSGNAETFQGMLASQNDSGLREALGGARFTVHDNDSSSHLRVSAKSLSHPNLSSIPPPRGVPRDGLTMTQALPTHSQAPPIPFPANLGGFTFSSMMGHFTSPSGHPQLQPQPISMNPAAAAAGGLMPGLGLSIGSNPAQQSSITIAPTLSFSNPSQMPPGLLTGAAAASNPPASIMNSLPQVSSLSTPREGGGGNRPPNLPPSTSLHMPLTHPIAANLQNPLLSGMPNMYSYPYATTLPTQPATTSPAAFPPHTLMAPGYPQYLPPSLYSNSPQQPR